MFRNWSVVSVNNSVDVCRIGNNATNMLIFPTSGSFGLSFNRTIKYRQMSFYRKQLCAKDTIQPYQPVSHTTARLSNDNKHISLDIATRPDRSTYYKLSL